MGNLKLVTTEKFGEIDCNFYRNMNDDILLTREQIGSALEYKSPSKAIQKIHYLHKDRLENLCIRIIDNRVPQNGGVGVNVETVYYSLRGIMEICRWSRQTKANTFMDWVWDIVEKYRTGEFTNQIDTKIFNHIANSLNNINDRLNRLEEAKQQTQQFSLHKKPFNPWFTRMSPKYKLLEEHFDVTRGQLYRNILLELENLYDIDTQQIQSDYCYENNIISCYPLEPYEFNKKYRDAIELLVNDSLTKYGIVSEGNPLVTRLHQTIFNN